MTVGRSKLNAASDSIGLARKTTAALSYYVETTGSDTNDGLSVETAFATIQHAIDLIPKQIEHLVTVSVGAGDFGHFHLANFETCTYNTGTFTIKGTQAEPTLGSGGKTNATSDASGGSTSVLSDADGGWIENELRGMFLLVGTEYRVIYSNTASTITVVCPNTSTYNSKAYQILENKTRITTANTTTSACVDVDSLSGSSYIYLEKMDAIPGNASYFGFAFYGNSHFQPRYLRAYGPATYGIVWQHNFDNNSARDSYAADCYIGFSFNYNGTFFRTRAFAYNCSHYGIIVAGPAGYNLTSNDIYLAADNCGDVGLRLYKLVKNSNGPMTLKCSNNTNMGCKIYECQIGIAISGTGNGTVGIDIENSGGSTISFTGLPTVTGSGGDYIARGPSDYTGVWATDLAAVNDRIILPDCGVELYRYS